MMACRGNQFCYMAINFLLYPPNTDLFQQVDEKFVDTNIVSRSGTYNNRQ